MCHLLFAFIAQPTLHVVSEAKKTVSRMLLKKQHCELPEEEGATGGVPEEGLQSTLDPITSPEASVSSLAQMFEVGGDSKTRTEAQHPQPPGCPAPVGLGGNQGRIAYRMSNWGAYWRAQVGEDRGK